MYHLENYPKFLPDDQSPHNRKVSGLIGPADIGDQAFADKLSLHSIKKVTIVRNPFSRAVSCYLNRIAGFGSEKYDQQSRLTEWVHNRIAILSWCTGRRVSIYEAASMEISFTNFIEFICEQHDYQMDRHWVSQRQATYVDTIDYDFIGRFENLKESMATIVEMSGGRSNWTMGKALNTTRKKIDIAGLFDTNLLRSFQRRFYDDFEIFGYSKDIMKC